MKCYRVYFKGECVGTFFNMVQAINHMNFYIANGDHATIEIEKYEY